VQGAKDRIGLANARLLQVKAGAKSGDVAAARARVTQAAAMESFHETELARTQKLVLSRVATPEGMNEKLAMRDRFRAMRVEAEQAADALAVVRGEDVAVADAELASATSALAQAEAELRLSEVRAPITGTILKIHTWPGEMASSSGLMEIADLSRLDAVVEVFEGDISRVRLGDPATISVPGTGKKVSGRVEKLGWKVAKRDVLSPDPVADLDSRVVEVRVRLNEPEARALERLTNTQVQAVLGE
jgi:HlyD family secretion protein